MKSIEREPFVQATVACLPVRDFIKMTLLPPPRPDDDVDEAEVRWEGVALCVLCGLSCALCMVHGALAAAARCVLFQGSTTLGYGFE